MIQVCEIKSNVLLLLPEEGAEHRINECKHIQDDEEVWQSPAHVPWFKRTNISL